MGVGLGHIYVNPRLCATEVGWILGITSKIPNPIGASGGVLFSLLRNEAILVRFRHDVNAEIVMISIGIE